MILVGTCRPEPAIALTGKIRTVTYATINKNDLGKIFFNIVFSGVFRIVNLLKNINLISEIRQKEKQRVSCIFLSPVFITKKSN